MKRIILELYQLSELEGQSQKVAIQAVKERFYNYAWERQNQESLYAFVRETTNNAFLFCNHMAEFLYQKIHRAEKGVYDNYFSGYKLEHFKRDYMPTGYHMDCVLWETFYDGISGTDAEKNETGHLSPDCVKEAFKNALLAFIKACKEDEAACEADSEIIMYADSNDHWFFKDGSYFQKGEQYDYVNRLKKIVDAQDKEDLS